MTWLARFRTALAALSLVAVACDAPPSMRDAGPDAGFGFDGRVVYPDGTVFCERDEECNDGVSCTVDSCAPNGTCRNTPDAALCDDGIFCNGAERCDRTQGCLPPVTRRTCNDHDVCTIDRCNEELALCEHSPRDLDQDGDPDFFCPGGGDCNDLDPSVSSLIREVCDDGVDNDCDGIIDEADCGAPGHDRCDDPLDVSAGGFFMLDTRGAAPDYRGSCGGTGGDLVATFTLTEERSVSIEAEGDLSNVTLGLRTECDAALSELACVRGYPASLRRRSLAPGTYFVIIESAFPGEVGLAVAFDEPIPPVTNDRCDAPIDVSAGGTFAASFVEVDDSTMTGCGFSGTGDLIYTFTTTEPRDVEITALSTTGEALSWAIRTGCEDATSELRCAYGAPASGRHHELPAGTYFLVVEGSSFRDVDLQLDVRFHPPTPPAPGDLCSDPLPLELGVAATGTLADKQDDLDVSCGFHYRDAVHTFTLPSASDVRVELDTGGYGNMSVRAACDDGASELRCASGNPTRALLRGLDAGTYYVIAEASRGRGYSLQVDASPPTPVVEVSGNEDCASAHPVPAGGGLFRGHTSTMSNDYTSRCGSGARSPDAVYTLTLDALKRVVLSTEGSAFDTVLHVHRDTCTSDGELLCNDDELGLATSLIDTTLAAGTYFIVVDGWGGFSSGEYYLEVTVRDP